MSHIQSNHADNPSVCFAPILVHTPGPTGSLAKFSPHSKFYIYLLLPPFFFFFLSPLYIFFHITIFQVWTPLSHHLFLAMSLSRFLLKNRSLAPATARLFSTSRLAASAAPLDFSKLTIERTKTPKTLPPPEQLIFGHTFTGTYAVFSPVCY